MAFNGVRFRPLFQSPFSASEPSGHWNGAAAVVERLSVEYG
jgi:hypothetical protein